MQINKVFGYRSKTWWKMIIATLYYLGFAGMVPTAISDSKYSLVTRDGAVDFVTNVTMLTMLLLPTILFSDFGYRDKLPLIRRRRFWSNLAGLSLCFVLAFTAFGVADSFHSEPYKAATARQGEADEAKQKLSEAQTLEAAKKSEARRQARLRAAADAKAAEEASAAALAREAAAAAAAAEASAAAEAKAKAEAESAVVVIAAEVVKIVDGDTAYFRLSTGEEEKVRFIGIDTPESTNKVERYGKEASAYTRKALAVGKTVYLEKDAEERDKYGRLLAYVWLQKPKEISANELREKLFNAQLAADGFAQQMTIPPNVKYASYFGDFVAEARSDEEGLWKPKVVAEPKEEDPPKSEPAEETYIANRNTKKFHYSYCRWVSAMNESNKVKFTSRKKVIARGYVPCKVCEP